MFAYEVKTMITHGSMTLLFHGELYYSMGACVTLLAVPPLCCLLEKCENHFLECKAKGLVFSDLKVYFPQSFKGQMLCLLLHSNCEQCTHLLPPFLGFGGTVIGKGLLANR